MAEIPARWYPLTCVCGSQLFYAVLGLQHHPTGGTTETVQQKRCVACEKPADVGAMWNEVRQAALKQALVRLQQEIAVSSGEETLSPAQEGR